jgi:hypothetical protein
MRQTPSSWRLDDLPPANDPPTDFAVVGARVFDGHELRPPQVVVISGGIIAAVSDHVPDGVEHVDGRGATLLPGLIDAHVHTDAAAQRLALTFGVTTTLDMGTFAGRDERRTWVADERSADIRAAGPPITAPAGHPTQMFVATRPDPCGPGPGSAGRDRDAGSAVRSARPWARRPGAAGRSPARRRCSDQLDRGHAGDPAGLAGRAVADGRPGRSLRF